MRKRSRARELALQILYQIEMTGDAPEAALADYWQAHAEENFEDELKDFSGRLVKGAAEHLAAIDKEIARHADNWQITRMAVIDKNIMRMSCFELLFCADIPPKVSINEAVELAKKYSGPEAGKFVNAILDKIKQEKQSS
jgi:transcription antitermination factor NusB